MRFDNLLTIIIPTYNRYKYLLRLLKYYDFYGFPARILILDASSDNPENRDLMLLLGNKRVEHRKFPPDIRPVEKLVQGIQNISTPYAVICADDDFITPEGIKKSVDFLENNSDFTIAHGHYIHFWTEESHKHFRWRPGYPFVSNTSSDPESRFLSHFINYVPTFFAVHRIDFLKMIFNEAVKFTSEVRFGELLPSMLALIYGKMKHLDVLYCARDSQPGSAGGLSKNLPDFIKEGTFDEKYSKFKSCLATHLRKQCNSNLDAEKIIDEAMQRYLQIHFVLKKEQIELMPIYEKEFLPGKVVSQNFARSVGDPSSKYYDDFRSIRSSVVQNSKQPDKSKKTILAMTYVQRHFKKMMPVLKQLSDDPSFDVQLLLFTPEEWRIAEENGIPFSRFEDYLPGVKRKTYFDWDFGLKAIINAIDQINPDMLFLMEVNYIARDAVRYANTLGIETFIMQHGTVLKTWTLHAFAPLEADHMATWGQFTNDCLIEIGVAPEKLIITGGPEFDQLNSLVADRSRVASEIGADPSKRWVVFTTQPAGPKGKPAQWENEKAVKQVCKTLERYIDVQIIFQVHPMQRVSDIEKYVDDKAIVCKYQNTSELISESVCSITMYSTTALDSILLDVDLLLINLREDLGGFPFEELGGALKATTDNEIDSKLTEILDGKASLERASSVEYTTYLSDGRACERIVAAITKCLQNHKKKLCAKNVDIKFIDGPFQRVA